MPRNFHVHLVLMVISLMVQNACSNAQMENMDKLQIIIVSRVTQIANLVMDLPRRTVLIVFKINISTKISA
jgi:hypothetical protein